MSEESSLQDTIVPKSDQLNADDLIIGPITVKVECVKRSSSPEQPIDICITGHRPFRPCKSMRRVLISVWGDKGSEWVGKSMTLYRDPAVKYGGVEVGGIRISHVSGIDEEIKLALTTTRAKRSLYKVLPLKTMDYEAHIRAFKDAKKMREWLVALAKENNWTKTTPVYVSLRNACAEQAKKIEADNAKTQTADEFDAGLGPVPEAGGVVVLTAECSADEGIAVKQ